MEIENKRDNDKRIAKNAIFLYFRIICSIVISLYTSRVVLEALGVRDYGIYNIVGGLIIVLSVFNSTMSGATQRFLNFEMGKGAEGRVAQTFSASNIIHISLSIIILILGETVGLWIVNNELVIAPERMFAANWAYQTSLFGGILSVLMVPFLGAVIAYEKMNIFAIFSLGFSVLKFISVLLLLYVKSFDSLIIFANLMLMVQLIHFGCYYVYVLKKFPDCTLKLKTQRDIIKSMVKYSASDLIGTSTFTFQNQGILFILNRLGGTVLNAAGGLCETVKLSITQFGNSIVTVFRPQIIKQYSANDIAYMQRLMNNCSKYSILLLALFSVPAFIEMDYILSLWLKEVPEYTAVFCRLGLLASIPQMAVLTLNCGIHASGKMFNFSLITGITAIIDIPLMYLLAKYTGYINWIYIIVIIQQVALIGIVSKMVKNRVPLFQILGFIKNGFFYPTLIILLVSCLIYLTTIYIEDGILKLFIVTAMSSTLLILFSWYLLFNIDMRKEVISALRKKIPFLKKQ